MSHSHESPLPCVCLVDRSSIMGHREVYTERGISSSIQENCTNEEILNSLKHVRPGSGFQPNFILCQKCEVNGKNTHSVFAYLKDKLPYPEDNPSCLMMEPKFIVWNPVQRNDISWNFEKFLVGPEGEPFKRYSPRFLTTNIEPDIQRLLKLAK
nr:glutathione peroxidase 2 isoform X1 [Pogona vitticeps]